MTLTELQYIVALAQERHFGRAAERSFVTQPALSLAIKKLEEELGVTIFERRKHQAVLTPLGEQIVHQAQLVLEEVDQIKLLAAQGKNQLVGALRLGAIATVGPYLLPDLVPLDHLGLGVSELNPNLFRRHSTERACRATRSADRASR